MDFQANIFSFGKKNWLLHKGLISIMVPLRKSGRVADCGCLENSCRVTDRGFESYLFRRFSLKFIEYSSIEKQRESFCDERLL